MMNWSSDNKKDERKVNRSAPEYLRLHDSDQQDNEAWPIFMALSDLDDDLLRDVKPAKKASSAVNVSEMKRAPKGKFSFWNRYRKSFAAAACLVVAAGMVLILRQSGLLKGIAGRPADKAENQPFDMLDEPGLDYSDGQAKRDPSLAVDSLGEFGGMEIDTNSSNFEAAPESADDNKDNSNLDSDTGKSTYQPQYASPRFEDKIALWFDRNLSSEDVEHVKNQFPEPKQAADYPRLMLMIMGELPANMPRLTLDYVETVVKTFDQNRCYHVTTATFQSEMERQFNEIAGAPDQLIRGADHQLIYYLGYELEEQGEVTVEEALQALKEETRAYIRIEGRQIWYGAKESEAEKLLYSCISSAP